MERVAAEEPDHLAHVHQNGGVAGEEAGERAGGEAGRQAGQVSYLLSLRIQYSSIQVKGGSHPVRMRGYDVQCYFHFLNQCGTCKSSKSYFFLFLFSKGSYSV